MKKQIVLATIATLATSSAWATKARMNALGQAQQRGSFYIKDTRQVFRNAARINQQNNYVLTEWGTAAQTQSSENAPQAEGGFFKNAGAFSYGVYLGSDITDQAMDTGNNGYADTLAGTTSGATYGDAGFLGRQNDLDFFFGGDMGVEWGVRAHYSKNTASTQKAKNYGIGLGMVMGDLNAYVNYVIVDETEGNAGNLPNSIAETDGTFDLGLGYKWMDYTFFVDYDKQAFEYKTSSNGTGNSTKRSDITVGVGYEREISSTSRLFSDLSLVLTSAKDENTNAALKRETDVTTLPFRVGFETDATSWLTLRGSVSQNVFINSIKTKLGNAAESKSTGADTTNVQAGATLNFGKLMVDGMIGTQAGARNGAPGTDQGVLALDNLMTQVAVHYWF